VPEEESKSVHMWDTNRRHQRNDNPIALPPHRWWHHHARHTHEGRASVLPTHPCPHSCVLTSSLALSLPPALHPNTARQELRAHATALEVEAATAKSSLKAKRAEAEAARLVAALQKQVMAGLLCSWLE
jgi:hypothetical protein